MRKADWSRKSKNTILITTLIITTINIYIGLIKFLEDKSSKIEHNAYSKIYKIYFSLNLYDNHEEKAANKTINKNNNKKTLK